MSNFQKRLRVGIMGTGWVATERHIPAFKRDSRTSLNAVLGYHLNSTESVAQRFKISRSFTSLEEFLADFPQRKAYISRDWWWEPLRSTPRFQAMVGEGVRR